MRVGVDTGGTFTDVIAVDAAGRIRVAKVASTPDVPARAVAEGVERVLDGEALDALCVGTTVATNALLERKGGAFALVTTQGFEDLIELRRQARPRLYALSPMVPEPLVPAAMRVGVRERMGANGEVVTALDDSEVGRVVAAVRALGVDRVAVCLLHAPQNAAHEVKLQDAFARAGIGVSRSSQIAAIPREYERTSTTVVDAYVAARMRAFVAEVAERFGMARTTVLQSTGGAVRAEDAIEVPVRTVLSGPAGGVSAALALSKALALPNVITLDIGGTSTDVAIIEDGVAAMCDGAEIAEVALQLPMLAVHTIGTGGGSIARLDRAGALVLGPDSAGAVPGPACYGRGGTSPTVTDANVVLGRFPDDARLAGTFALDRTAAEQSLTSLAEGLGGVRRAAEEIVALAELKIASAIRRITVEHGRDPREFVLMAFGGAGPMHACAVARELGIARVVVPAEPGLFCAFGALTANLVYEHTTTILRDLSTLSDADMRGLRDAVREAMSPRAGLVLRASAQLRYLGQSFELSVGGEMPVRALADAFHVAHEKRFGFALRDRAIELVRMTLQATGQAPQVSFTPRSARVGHQFSGPRSIVELSATTFLPEGSRAEVIDHGALSILV